MAAISRLGLYGGPRPAYGSFAGKTEVIVLLWSTVSTNDNTESWSVVVIDTAAESWSAVSTSGAEEWTEVSTD